MAPIPNDGQSSSSSNSTFGTTINGAAFMVFWFIMLLIILYSIRCIYVWCVQRRYRRRSGSDQQPLTHLIIAIGAPQLHSLDPPRTGLHPSVIAALPTFVYKKPDSRQIDGTGAGTTDECSICLSNIEEEEMVRLLPNCVHMFHAGCIDMWLSSHLTCPICRTNVMAELPQAPPPPAVPEQEESSSEVQTTTHGTTGDHEVTTPRAPTLNTSMLTPTSSEGTASDNSTAPTSFHKILSLKRSGRRIQPFELSADGVVEDRERQ